MKQLLLLCLIPFIGMGQILISDNFSDGDFINSPTWFGSDSIFKVNNSHQLQLDANVAGSAYLFTHSTISDSAVWEFYAHLDFNPSSSNYAQVYLMASDSLLHNALNGYFVRIGGSSSDKLGLYRQDGNNAQLLVESTNDYLDAGQVFLRVKVERDPAYLWVLKADTGLVVDPLQNLGSLVDSTYSSSAYFGLNCVYTKTRSKLFYFDDFSLTGKPYTDNRPPRISDVQVRYKDSLQIIFNEKVNKSSSEDFSKYELLNSSINVMGAIWDSIGKKSVLLKLDTNLIYGGNYHLKVEGVEDLHGNLTLDSLNFFLDGVSPKVVNISATSDSSLLLDFNSGVNKNSLLSVNNYFVNNGIGVCSMVGGVNAELTQVEVLFAKKFQNTQNYRLGIKGLLDSLGFEIRDTIDFSWLIPQLGDVVFNEIMADPSPVIGIPPQALPEREYLELFNRTENYINLQSWTLNIGNTSRALKPFMLKPKSYALISKDEFVHEFHDSIPVMGLDISSTALKNTGAQLELWSPHGELISQINYTDQWYKDPNKENGGWSLEQIDPHNLCGGINNWEASKSNIGGSPGFINSVNGVISDTLAPAFDKISVSGDSSIVLWFSEMVPSEELLDVANYLVKPQLAVANLDYYGTGKNAVEINFIEPIEAEKLYYLSMINYPEDCNGNRMQADSILFAIPAIPEKGDLLINEILFDPLAGGADFVEVYNQSDKVFDMSKLLLANWDGMLSAPYNPVPISDEAFLWEPKAYKAFCTDIDFLENQYDIKKKENLIEVKSLPSMPDDEGTIAIATSFLMPVDHFSYKDDLHLKVLNNTEGVSLERVSFKESAQNSTNWQSAAATVGFATPGHENSHQFNPSTTLKIEVRPKVFTPNQDGFHDLVAFVYNFEKANSILNVSIWNSEGNIVKVLLNNQNVAKEGVLFWDGVNESGNILMSGIYIVLFEYFNEVGGSGQVKKTCVLSR